MILKIISYTSFTGAGLGHEFQIAFINVANGIEKNAPQKPNIPPNTNTASIITTGWSLTASENRIGTSKFPSRA